MTGETEVDEKTLFTQFWTTESQTTKKVFERIPEGSDYRPDPKSRTAQEIAWQIVCEEKMIIEALETGRVQWAPPPMPRTMKEIVDVFDRQSRDIIERWKRLPAERWSAQLDFMGHERPAGPMAWSFLFDIVHHRGQITTYLRPMGSTVPQVYGPSADEPMG
ncbi:MAG TPA: DinB family protein [Longimicrobiales bacterium]